MKFIIVIIVSSFFSQAVLAFSQGPCDRTDRFERVQTDLTCQSCHNKIKKIAKKIKMKLSGQLIFVHLNTKQASSPGITTMAKEYQKSCMGIKGAPELTIAVPSTELKNTVAEN